MICPFCIPEFQISVFARTHGFLAVYNIAPIVPGHSLIVPEKHIQSIMELDEGALSGMMIFSRRVSSLLKKVFKAEAFNWSLQEGTAAGQTVEHLHMHIVLRFPGDMPDPGDWYPEIRKNYSAVLDSASRPRLISTEMESIVKELRGKAMIEGLYER